MAILSRLCLFGILLSRFYTKKLYTMITSNATSEELLQKVLNAPENRFPEPCKAAISLLLLFGLRVGEVLRLSPRDFVSENSFVAPAEKGGRHRLCTVPVMKDFWRAFAAGSLSLGELVNYKYVYRRCRELGFGATAAFGQKRAVTHAGRKLLVTAVAERSRSISVAADVIGHRSARSTEYYLPSHKGSPRASLLSNTVVSSGPIYIRRNGVIVASVVRKPKQ